MAQPQTTSHELNRRLLHYRSRSADADAIELAQALLRENRLGDARGVLVSAQPQEGETAELLLLEGRAWLQEGQVEQALAKFLRAATLEPEAFAAYLGLGEALTIRRDFVRAQAALERALLLRPDCPDAARMLTQVRQELAVAEAAIDGTAATVDADDYLLRENDAVEVEEEDESAQDVGEPDVVAEPSHRDLQVLEVEVAAPESMSAMETERPSAPEPSACAAAVSEPAVSEPVNVNPSPRQVLAPVALDSWQPPVHVPAAHVPAFASEPTGLSLLPAERLPSLRRPATRTARSIALAAALCGAGLGLLSLQFASPSNVGQSAARLGSEAAKPRASVAVVQEAKPRVAPALPVEVVAHTPEATVAAMPEVAVDDESARLSRAEAALARGDAERALAELAPLRRAEQRSVRMLGLLGRALYATSEVNLAAGAYDTALSMAPNDATALLGRAEVHLRAGRFEDAFVLLTQVQEQVAHQDDTPSVERSWLLALMGHAYLQRRAPGDRELAEAALTQVTALKDAPAEAYFWLGESLSGRRTPEAKAAYSAYLEREPNGRYKNRARRALSPLL